MLCLGCICREFCRSSYDAVYSDTGARYEWFLSLSFDWDFISGKKRLRWPLVSCLC